MLDDSLVINSKINIDYRTDIKAEKVINIPKLKIYYFIKTT